MIVVSTVSLGVNRKYALDFGDGTVECAYLFLPYRDDYQHIFCVSSQIGCPFNCVFCSNSKTRFLRNLSIDEINAQIEILDKNCGRRSDSRIEIDLMGVGEPMCNIDNTLKLINSLAELDNISIGISTILPKIDIHNVISAVRNEKVRLQISLHTAVNDRREKMLGIPSDYGRLLRVAKIFYEEIPFRRVSFNICLIDGLNDSDQDLSALLTGKEIINACGYIKLSYPNSDEFLVSRNIKKWENRLCMEKVPCKVFRSAGVQKEMGCGQIIARETR